MEKSEEENGVENNPNNTKEDHTHDIPYPGNSESDETGVDSAVHAEETGTAVVSNGKTDDNQNKKDTSQEVPEESDPAQYATGHDTIPAKVLVKTDTSKSKQEPDPGSSANFSEQIDNPPTQDATVDDKIRSEAANKTVSPTSSDLGCSPLGPKPGFDQDTRRPADAPLADHKEPVANKKGEVIATQNSDSSSKGTEPKTKEEDEKQNTERSDRDVPDGVKASVPFLYDNTSTSGTSKHSQNLDLQVTEHDIGASQLEGDEGHEEAAMMQLLTNLYYTKSPEEDEKQNTERSDRDVPDGVKASVPSLCDNTSTSNNSEHSQNLAMQGLQVTQHDIGASQLEGDEGPEEAAIIQLLMKLYYTKFPEGPRTTADMPEETSRTMSSENGSTTQPTTNSAEAPKQNDEAQDATDLSDEKENTNASECEEMTGGDGSSPEHKKPSDEAQDVTDLFEEMTGDGSSSGVPGTTQGELSEMVQSAETRVQQKSDSLKEEAEEGPGTASKTSKTMSSKNGSTTQLTTNSSVEVLKLKANEKVKKSNDETPAATDTSIITSEKLGNTDASRSEGKGSSSVNEPMKEPQVVAHDNGTSQLEGDEEFHDAVDITCGKADVSSKIVKPNNPEEMKTGSGANKDDDKEGQPKKKKAKGEGVEGGVTSHAVKTEQHVIKERSVSISLCTSAYCFNVEGLVSYLKGLMKKHPELIKEVKIHELPYNDLDHYRFDEKDPVDVMILCHSINNRRFAITDVMDALYDKYLPYCARVVGKEKMGVIVHDFDDMRETVQSSRMSSFKYKQPKAFETTSLQITCGHIEKEEQVLKQMSKADRNMIVGFLEHASKYPEEMQKEEKWMDSLCKVGFGSSGRANEGQIKESNILTPTEPDPPRGTSPATQQSPGAVHATAAPGTQGAIYLPSQKKMTHNSGRAFTSAPQSSYATPRPISVSVCSSAYKHNVKGLLSWLTKFQAKQTHMITDVHFRELPYQDIDSFRFPQNDPVDVMVLCHSVDNRGFSITNVLNALYEKYLKYCNKLIGKKKLAVIVHDFADCKPAIVEGRMESFRRMQPLTFELVDTVIICGRLKDPAKLGIREEDLTRLMCFLELARFEPKENFKQSLFGNIF